jgi:hypothetical protein
MSPSSRLAQAVFEPDLFPYEYPNILNPGHSLDLPASEDGTECSKTLAYKIQTVGNYPEGNIQHSGDGKSLKSRIVACYLVGDHISLHSLFVVICCYILLLLVHVDMYMLVLDQLDTSN